MHRRARVSAAGNVNRRPAAAAVVGVSAGTALVVLRVRARHRVRKQRSSNLLELAQRTMQDAAEEARRILPHR